MNKLVINNIPHRILLQAIEFDPKMLGLDDQFGFDLKGSTLLLILERDPFVDEL